MLKVSTSDTSCQTPLHLTNKIPRKMKLLIDIWNKDKEIKGLKKQFGIVNQKLTEVNIITQMLMLCEQNLLPSFN